MDIDAKIDKKAAILGLDLAGYSIKYNLNELSDEELIKLINNHTESYEERAWYGNNPDYCPDCGFKMEEDNEKITCCS